MKKKLILKSTLILLTVLATFSLSACDEETNIENGKSENLNNDSTENYTVTWINDDESVLETDKNVKKGDMPSYDGSTPVKEGNAEYSYIFDGWDKELLSVSGNISYKAKFKEVINQYDYSFIYEDEVIKSGKVNYGTVVEAPENPVKQNNAEFSYSFAGWYLNNELVTEYKILGDSVFTAQFNSTKNKYDITFVNYDDTLIEKTEFEYGVIPTCSVTPTKEGNAEISYVFTGWDTEIVSVTGEKTYKAQFEDVKNKYNIKFINYDDSLVEESEVEYGKTPSCSITPERPNTNTKVYTFSGWDTEIEVVTGDKTYKAQYQESDRLYSIKFYDGDNVYSETKLKYDENITSPTDPKKEGSAQYSYSFAGWYDKDGNKVTDFGKVNGDVCYYAKYNEIVNKYTVTFKNQDGSILDTQELEYGAITTYDDEPSMDSTAQYDFYFDKWDKEFSEVIGDTTYTAYYNEVLRSYNVKFYGYNNDCVYNQQLDYGEDVSFPSIETYYEYAYYNYTFDGWYTKTGEKVLELNTVTGDIELYANFKEAKNKFTITFDSDGGSEVEPITQEWGLEVTAPANPTKDGFKFDKWVPEVPKTMGQSDTTCVAKWKKVTYKVNIEISDTDKAKTNIISGAEYEFGDKVSFEAKAKSGYLVTVKMNGTEISGSKIDFDMPGSDVQFVVTVSVYQRNDNTILFGAYPQKELKNVNIEVFLLEKVGDLPSNASDNGWYSYNYYDGTSRSDYMWYKDVEYDYDKYRAVYFTKYRAAYGSDANTDNSLIDDYGYQTGKIYFFKYEPIEWTVLEEADGKAKLVSNLVLDSQIFTFRTDTSKKQYHANNSMYTGYANTYFYSDIRIWLNSSVNTIDASFSNSSSFQNKAFNGYIGSFLEKLGQATGKADDYITLFSEKYFDKLDTLVAKGTDYAKIQGLEVTSDNRAAYYTTSGDSNIGNLVKIVNENGEYTGTKACYLSSVGVRPVINLKL